MTAGNLQQSFYTARFDWSPQRLGEVTFPDERLSHFSWVLSPKGAEHSRNYEVEYFGGFGRGTHQNAPCVEIRFRVPWEDRIECGSMYTLEHRTSDAGKTTVVFPIPFLGCGVNLDYLLNQVQFFGYARGIIVIHLDGRIVERPAPNDKRGDVLYFSNASRFTELIGTIIREEGPTSDTGIGNLVVGHDGIRETSTINPLLTYKSLEIHVRDVVELNGKIGKMQIARLADALLRDFFELDSSYVHFTHIPRLDIKTDHSKSGFYFIPEEELFNKYDSPKP